MDGARVSRAFDLLGYGHNGAAPWREYLPMRLVVPKCEPGKLQRLPGKPESY